MSKDPEEWLFGQPLDPDDHPRSVWIDRMIAARKRWQWLWKLLLGVPAGGAVFFFAWEIIKLLVAKFGGGVQ